ncbi:hypothetical protein PGT21_003712 [Puccinia graminis f. sp. tritici]|uniref:RING-type domain-containing protein n=1 Tax=Puccinia graminis f. sp. tritici TaxID=56615 RepID=A0A5B0SJC5_PUCGR|nr:hypothetical protein PGT21_003712 [Puccinia graminis f. sp. tritici]KAA1137233.1 hypothetical protein PGTUg99_008283 [Puccinia graminis f. sp. tritici]
MLLVFSILVTMLLQVVVLGTPTIHAADQIGLPIPVGPKSLLKPVHQHTKRMNLVENNQYSSEMCTICRDELGAKSYRWPTCLHLFHFRCIDEWRSGTGAQSAECPNCKSADPILARQKNPQNNSQGGESSSGIDSPSYATCFVCSSRTMHPVAGQRVTGTGRIQLICSQCRHSVTVRLS